MEEYLMFCDETKKTTGNEFFIFGGFAVTRKYYSEYIIPEINALKKKHFGDCNIIFHYTEMKNNKGDFHILTDPHKRNAFYSDYRTLIASLDITTFIVYYNQDVMQDLYNKKSNGHYNIGFMKLLENYIHFLIDKSGYGCAIIESRTLYENSILLDAFYDYKRTGSVYFRPDIVQKHISSIGFNIKEDNCIGLQIADFIPASISRVLNNKSDKQLIAKTFKQKLYKRTTEYEAILGLKSIL